MRSPACVYVDNQLLAGGFGLVISERCFTVFDGVTLYSHRDGSDSGSNPKLSSCTG